MSEQSREEVYRAYKQYEGGVEGGETEPLIQHEVDPLIRELVGIPEGEPAALLTHVTRVDSGYNIAKHGLVNVSGRGTLSSMLATDSGRVGIPSILEHQTSINKRDIVLVNLCVPAKWLRVDNEGKYGMWFDNRLEPGDSPELWKVYNNIAIKYDGVTGKPTRYAKDDANLYPVHIPNKYIFGVATFEDRARDPLAA